MPKGTRVHRCVDTVKRKGGGANAYAVCQSATKQSYATGKSLKSHMPAGATLSPRGDLGARRAAEAAAVVRIPGWGGTGNAASALPVRRHQTASD